MDIDILNSKQRFPYFVERNYLLSHSYIVKQQIKRIKRWKSDKHRAQGINNLASRLAVNPQFIFDLVTNDLKTLYTVEYHPDVTFVDDTSLVLSPQFVQNGVYLSIDPRADEKEILSLFRKLKQAVSPYLLQKEKRKQSLDKSCLEMYLAVERKIPAAIREKKSNIHAEKDSKERVLRIASSYATNTFYESGMFRGEPEEKLDALINQVKMTHHKVTKSYSLPEYSEHDNFNELTDPYLPHFTK